MDLREFFDALEKNIENLENSFAFGSFFDDSYNHQQNVRPRDLMLKNSNGYLHRSNRPMIDHSHPNHHDSIKPYDQKTSSSFKTIVKEFETDSTGFMKEKTIIKDSDGNEKIKIKEYDGNITLEKEILKKDDQIVTEKEMMSDIDDSKPRIKDRFVENLFEHIWPFRERKNPEDESRLPNQILIDDRFKNNIDSKFDTDNLNSSNSWKRYYWPF
ncbi:hypothetical protein NH340_JMT01866 [Sarcoptes scabiei]|nr:hypothetical protein NH340_JMT01866 [Sarcoptes scabiei]